MKLRIFIISIIATCMTAMNILIGCSPVGFAKDTEKVCSGLPGSECYNEHGDIVVNSSYLIPSPKVDILIVDDNSTSMIDEQARMGAAFGNFIQSLSGLNWQIGITTTDVSNSYRQAHGEIYMIPSNNPAVDNYSRQDGKLIPFAPGVTILREGQANAASLFANTIQMDGADEQGSGDERGILTSTLAIQNEFRSGGLVRPEATHLAIIYMSDEDVRGGGEANNPASLFAITERDRQSELERVLDAKQVQYPSSRKTVSVHSIVVPRSDTNCYNQQHNQAGGSGNYGLMYQAVAESTRFSGSVGRICDTSYSALATQISNRISDRTLGDIPTGATCILKVGDAMSPLTITLTQGYNVRTFRLGLDPLPSGITNVQSLEGRLHFTPDLNAGTTVAYSGVCN